MPRIHRVTGQIADRRRDWFDDTRTVFQDCSSGVCRIVLSDGTVLAERGANDVIGGGGSWAGWLAGFGLFGNTLGHLPDAGIHDTQTKLVPASPDGAIAYKPLRNSFGPWAVREKDGSEWPIPGDVDSVCLLGGRTAVWRVGSQFFYNGTLSIERPGAAFGWSACLADDRVATVYQSAVDGSLVLNGRRIAPSSPLYFYVDVAFIDGAYRVEWSPNQADTDPQMLVVTPAALAACPLVGVTPDPIVVPPTQPPQPPKDIDMDLARLLTPRIDIVQAVHRDYPNLDAGDTTDQVIHRLNREYQTDVFGRKLKNDGHTLNDDVVTILLDRNDRGKKKLIDILIAGNPANPMWDVRPESEEAGNGTWTPAATPDRDGGSQGDPGDENDAKKPHAYVAGDHDGGTCDLCGQVRSAAIHQAAPEKPPTPTGSLDVLVSSLITAALAPLKAEIAALKTRLAEVQRKPDAPPSAFPSRIALKTAHGKFVVAEEDGSVAANRDGVGAWETFEVIPQ